MTQKRLNILLDRHKLWLDSDYKQGCKLVLVNEDLRGLDLSYRDLRNADLSNANLCRADLRGADLSNANLDFATLPLWCGGSRFITDDSIVRQILAHVCTIKCENLDWLALREVILPFARKSHRANDLHLLEDNDDV